MPPECEARQLRQHVNPHRRQTHLEDDARTTEILRAHLLGRGAELLERRHLFRGILRRGIHPYVEVARRARPSVHSQRVGADDKEPDVTVDERAQ